MAEILYCKFTFNSNGGSPTYDAKEYSASSNGDTINCKIPSTYRPTRQGYNFLGWKLDGTNTIKQNGESYAAPAVPSYNNRPTHKWVAQWQAMVASDKRTVISFVNEAGTKLFDNIEKWTSATTQNIQIPSSYKPTAPTGYKFDHWRMDTFATKYYAGNTYSFAASKPGDPSGSYTMIAVFTVKTYTVTLNAGSGTGGTSSVTATYGQNLPPITKPTLSGYTFEGYYTGSNGTGDQYYSSSGDGYVWDIDGNRTLYAYWKVKPVTIYTANIVFNTNGGTGGPSNFPATGTSTTLKIDLPSTYPRKTGYNFLYWSYGGSQYDPGDEDIKVSASIGGTNNTFKAIWEAKTYTITLDNTGGSPSQSSIDVTYDQTVAYLSSKPTKTGYRFGGYYTSKSASGTRYYDENGNGLVTWQSTSNSLVLYAYWIALPLLRANIIFDANGGVNPPSNDVKYGYSSPLYIDLPSTEPSKKGCEFLYWTLNGSTYKAGKTNVPIDASEDGINNTFVAQWEANDYTVYLNNNGGVPSEGSVVVTYDQTITSLVGKLPTRTGYKFTGYFTENGTQYYDENGNGLVVWKDTSDSVTLYAHWDKLTRYTITIEFNISGGTGSIERYTNEIYADSTPTFTVRVADTPEKTGYDFAYWECGENIYKAGSTWLIPAGSYVFRAIWTGKKYTLTLHKEGGTGGQASVEVTYGSKLPQLTSIPTKTSSYFGGYYSSTDYSNATMYYNSSGVGQVKWEILGNGDAYAYWTSVQQFAWTHAKIKDEEFNLTKEEWDRLQVFVNNKRETAFEFTPIVQHVTVFTKDIYNEMVNAIGKGTQVKSGQIVTADLMNELVTNANAM